MCNAARVHVHVHVGANTSFLCTAHTRLGLREARSGAPCRVLFGSHLVDRTYPGTSGALPKLKELDVSSNALTELPAGLANGGLRVLHAADNPLLLRLHDEAGDRPSGETEPVSQARA